MFKSEEYRSICIEKYDLLVHSSIHTEEIRTILGQAHQLSKCKRPFRRRGFVELIIDDQISRGFLKNNKIIGFLRKPKLFIRSIRILKNGKLLNEGNSYLRCEQLELPIPRLLFFGDKKIFGMRCEEVILSDKVFGKSIMERYQNTHDESWLYSAMDCLIKFHRAGMSRGDCMLHNFINDGKITVALDLEECATLTNEAQFHDLTEMVLSILLLSNNTKIALDVLCHYEKKSKLEMPTNKERIIKVSDMLYQDKKIARNILRKIG